MFPRLLVIAAAVILSLYWNKETQCPVDTRNRWNWWIATAAVRMLLYTAIVLFIQQYEDWLNQPDNATIMRRMTYFRNITDALGIAWFLVGNIWVFGGDDCVTPGASPTYQLAVAFLIINYIQICLPCIIALLMIPVFCCCMPCLIRFLARFRHPNAPKGATDAIIASMPITIITDELISEEKTCPVCLSDMVVGEEARLLTCRHLFHKQCVDEWLRVNASCPTCRMNIITGLADGDVETSENQPSRAESVVGGISLHSDGPISTAVEVENVLVYLKYNIILVIEIIYYFVF